MAIISFVFFGTYKFSITVFCCTCIFFYRNYKLLSFGDEAEEQEEEVDLASKDSKGKGKSSHDLIDDPTLSTEITEIDSEEVRQRLAQPPKVCC